MCKQHLQQLRIHYFGMSCFARHGKLFEKYNYIEALLNKRGFELEHENVYYSSPLKAVKSTNVQLVPHNLTKGNQQYIDFMLEGGQVGGCEVHYIDNAGVAYLRWIYVSDNIMGRGIGNNYDYQCQLLCDKGYVLAELIYIFKTNKG
mgnify:CR=1 FL=1